MDTPETDMATAKKYQKASTVCCSANVLWFLAFPSLNGSNLSLNTYFFAKTLCDCYCQGAWEANTRYGNSAAQRRLQQAYYHPLRRHPSSDPRTSALSYESSSSMALIFYFIAFCSYSGGRSGVVVVVGDSLSCQPCTAA